MFKLVFLTWVVILNTIYNKTHQFHTPINYYFNYIILFFNLKYYYIIIISSQKYVIYYLVLKETFSL